MKPTRFRDKRALTSYVTNADLLPLIARDKANNNTLSNELATLLMMIAEKYSQTRGWKDYSFREDMVAEAMASLCKTWHKFDAEAYTKKHPEKQLNPFSFYTTSCYYSFLLVIAREKVQREIRDDLLFDAGITPSWGYRGASDGAFGAQHDVNEA